MCLSIKVDRPECVLLEGEHAGYQFVVTHNAMGYRCGYARVPKGHKWHGKDYGDIECNVHGGLTFAEPDKHCDGPGEDDAWWLGFDCGHAGDAPDPEIKVEFPMPSFMAGFGTVKTTEYVEAECKKLCEQIFRNG